MTDRHATDGLHIRARLSARWSPPPTPAVAARLKCERDQVWAAAWREAVAGGASPSAARRYADRVLERAALHLAVLRLRLELAEILDGLAARLRGAR